MPISKTDRESIIVETIRLFKVRGYHSTTMANIGEACGLIKGSIYHHFKNKEALALECLQYIHRYFEEEIFSLAYQSELSPRARLFQFNKRVEEYFLNSDGGCLLGNFALEISNTIEPLKKEVVAYFKRWEEAMYEILRTSLSPSKAKQAASQAVAATQGSIMLMRIYEDSEPFLLNNRRIAKLLN